MFPLVDLVMLSSHNTSREGGLYELTHAAQGKGGSATDVMNPAKLRISGQGW